MIVAHALTESTVDDATVGIDLIGAAGGIASVTADAAYDTVAFYEAASARHAQVVVPPTRSAKVSRRRPRSRARDRTIADVETLGRRAWQKASGYHRQARVENAFFRYKSIIGDGLRARSVGGRVTCLANSGPVAVSKSAANLASSPRECDLAVRIRLVREF